MNKKIVAISILLLMFFSMTAAVFASDTECEYEVTVYYDVTNVRTGKKERNSKSYTIWAFSAREAETKAQELCEYDFGNVVSCGGARATGKKR